MQDDPETLPDDRDENFEDPYQALARGESRDDEDGEDPDSSTGKITGTARTILILCAVVLDILSVFEIPIADAIALAFSVVLFIYFFYVGASPIRSFVTWMLAWAVELVPVLDLLPFYLTGMLIVIAIDRSKVASTAVSYIPSKQLATKRIGSKVGNKASRLSKNAAFGRKSIATRRQASLAIRKIESLQKELPGPLRSVPWNMIRGTSTGISRFRGTEPVPASAPGPQGELPFPDTYYQMEREINPSLEDIVDVDVTGERTVAEASKRKAAGGPGGTNQVQ